jgi:membrane protein YdbS with pleckstrin-like domain
VNKSQNPEVANAAQLQKLPFQLQDGEKIIRELKPQFLGFMISRGFGGYMALLAFVILAIGVGIILLSGVLMGLLSSVLLIEINESFVIGLAIIPFAIFLIISIKPFISYGKSWYWITNNRVIGKRGFLGYSIDSIPLENVSDVVLSRTVLDRLLGLSSLIIVPMAASPRVKDGPDESAENPNFFPALPQNMAMELQRVLFNLRDELRKSHDSASASSGSTRASTPKPTSSESAQPKSNFPRSAQ